MGYIPHRQIDVHDRVSRRRTPVIYRPLLFGRSGCLIFASAYRNHRGPRARSSVLKHPGMALNRAVRGKLKALFIRTLRSNEVVVPTWVGSDL